MRGIKPDALDGCPECGNNELVVVEWSTRTVGVRIDDSIQHMNVRHNGGAFLSQVGCEECDTILVEDGSPVHDGIDAEPHSF